MSEPIFIEPLPQKTTTDCAIVCLAMYLGMPYLRVVQATSPNMLKRGMFVTEIISTAVKLGIQLRVRRRIEPDDSGILRVSPLTKGEQPHVVMLLGGLIYDPGPGRLWADMEMFLQTEHYTTTSLLVRVD